LSITALSVAWVLAHPAVTAPIIGASRPEQLTESLAGADAVLDADLKAELDRITDQYRGVPAI
jgi:aryl-alcohol dehydrogenase-like predicted oxidoreductase